MAYNPNILRNALKARSLSQAELSRRLGLEASALEEELRRAPEPRQSILNSIAKELSVPPFAFFMTRTPELHEVIPDFRLGIPAPRAKARETISSIAFAEGIQRALAIDEGDAPVLPRFNATDSADVDSFALKAREYFEISIEEQISARDDGAFYVLCRKKIEEKGIFVLHDSFPEGDGSGYCLFDTKHPVIVVNTKRQTRGRRLFTLIHELAHILMRKSGISDPFVRENSIERLCNRFAGAFLVPAAYVRALLGSPVHDDPSTEDVRRASKRLKISQEATALRLEQLHVYKTGSYEKWKSGVGTSNPDFAAGGGGGGPTPQEKVKLARYGFRFAKIFRQLLGERISEVNLYRATGLKPKYQRAYFDYVHSLSDDELPSLELDDD